jgi:defect-in-organelle-trafficking protein DotC
LARIKQDLKGMILYRKLLAMNMVSPPFVAQTDLGITGDSNEINIDDRVLRITALPELNPNSKDWRAAVTKDETALQHFEAMEQKLGQARIEITNQAWQSTVGDAEQPKLDSHE